MALNSSGPLSFGGATTGQSINLELGVSATALASINSTAFRNLAGVASGAISVSNFYGKSSVTYYAIKLTAGSLGPWYDSQVFTIDGSGNYYFTGSTNTGFNTVFLKIAADGSAISYASGYQITAPGGVFGSNTNGMATNSAGTTLYLSPYFMGAYSSTQSTGVFPTLVSSTGTVTIAGGLRQFTFSGQTYSYTASGYSPAAVSSAGDYYYIVSGAAYYLSGYGGACCCVPIYSNLAGAMMLFKYNSSGTITLTRTFFTNATAYNYSTKPLVLSTGRVILAGFNNNNTWAIINCDAGITSTSWTNQMTFSPSNWTTPTTSYGPGWQELDNTNSSVITAVAWQNNTNANRGGAVVASITQAAGTFNWAVACWAASKDINAQGLAVDSSGNTYVCANEGSTSIATVVKLNSSGTVQWQRTFSCAAVGMGMRMLLVTTAGTLAFYFYRNSGFGTAYYYMTYPLDGSKTGTVTVGGQAIVIGTGSLTISVLTGTKGTATTSFGNPSLGSNGLSSNSYTPTGATVAVTAY